MTNIEPTNYDGITPEQPPVINTGNKLRNATTVLGVGVVTGLLTIACSADNSEPGPLQPGLSGESTQGLDGTTIPETTTTTEALKTDQEKAVDELLAAGYDEAAIAELMNTITPKSLLNPEACIGFVEAAKGGPEAARKDGFIGILQGVEVINISAFNVAGTRIVQKGGDVFFTDSTSTNFAFENGKDVSNTPEDTAKYFGNDKDAEALNKEAIEEQRARLCGGPYQLSEGIVTLANAKIGNTNVRIGDLDDGILHEALVSLERTDEEMTKMVKTFVDRYVVEQVGPVDTVKEVEALKEAYDNQEADAVRLIAILDTLMSTINQGNVTVQSSFVRELGLTENGFPKFAYSSLGKDSKEDGDLGGEYLAPDGTVLEAFSSAKAGCISIEGVMQNLLDGRFGYILVNSAPEGCEPMYTVVTTSTVKRTPPPTVPPTTSREPGKAVPATTQAPPPVTLAPVTPEVTTPPPATAPPDTLAPGVIPNIIDTVPTTSTIFDSNLPPVTVPTSTEAPAAIIPPSSIANNGTVPTR